MTVNQQDMPGNTRYRRREDLAITRVEDDYFLVHPATEAIFHLNALGRAIWDLLEEPQTGEGLVAALTAAFPDTPASTIGDDVTSFLVELERARLIERSA